MTIEEKYRKVCAEMIEINTLIYARGVALGSHEYFRIREIASAYVREQEGIAP